ncbi:MAG: radical SAM protein [Syntrophales bacterium]
MRFRKVLLVSPPAESRYGGLRVPAGVGYIAQALHDNGIEYEYVDMRIGRSFMYLKRKAFALKPDIVGFSMSSLGYRNTYRLISGIKEVLPGVKIVVGGHHVTVLKDRVLRECADIDFGVVADGEQTIIDLCRDRIPYCGIPGLIFRDGQQVVFNGERPVTKNLDSIAFPKYEKFEMRNYSKQIPVHSSRGCVNQCTFCPNRMIARKFRTRSVGHFVDEIEYWYSRGIRQFAIDDDNFSLNRRRVLDICDEIEKRKLTGLFIRCSNGLRADTVDRELLERMKEVGVREVGFGVDGGNNRMLAHLKKGETIDVIEKAVREACGLGLDVRLFFMIGTPHETKEDIEDSLRLAKKYPVTKVNLNNPIPYPGTEMYDYIETNNLFLIPPEVYLNNVAEHQSTPVFETPELPAEARLKILKRCQKIEREIIRSAVARAFNRYAVVSYLLKYFFAVGLFEKLFFNNIFFRNLFERIRYKKLIKT